MKSFLSITKDFMGLPLKTVLETSSQKYPHTGYKIRSSNNVFKIRNWKNSNMFQVLLNDNSFLNKILSSLYSSLQ